MTAVKREFITVYIEKNLKEYLIVNIAKALRIEEMDTEVPDYTRIKVMFDDGVMVVGWVNSMDYQEWSRWFVEGSDLEPYNLMVQDSLESIAESVHQIAKNTCE